MQMLYRMIFLTYEFNEKTDLDFEDKQPIKLGHNNKSGEHQYFTTASSWNIAENKQQYEIEHHIRFNELTDDIAISFVKEEIIPVLKNRFKDFDVFTLLNSQDEIILTEEEL